VSEIDTSTAEDLLDFIHREGYRRCDVAACNCGSFHGGHSMARLTEIEAALTEADIDGNGRTILSQVRALAAERDELDEVAKTYSVSADNLAGKLYEAEQRADAAEATLAQVRQVVEKMNATRDPVFRGILFDYADRLSALLDASEAPHQQGKEQKDVTRVVGQPDSQVALPQRTTR
jgi:hypothetical protein